MVWAFQKNTNKPLPMAKGQAKNVAKKKTFTFDADTHTQEERRRIPAAWDKLTECEIEKHE